MEVCIGSISKENVTLTEVNLFNLTDGNITLSGVSQVRVPDLHGAYRLGRTDLTIMYKWIAFILTTIALTSNLTVVISSGLILRKAYKHKSTYMLLGNVSLGDSLLSVSVLFAYMNINGMMVCSGIVSVFSICLIAVDRYIYIVHGLYYRKWFTTTRVRIIILCIWMIGICLGFLPATGWVNHELLKLSLCQFITVYPGTLILLILFISIMPITISVFLYFIILAQALNNLKNIKVTKTNLANLNSINKSELNVSNGNTNVINGNTNVIKRSASFSIDNTVTLHHSDIPSKSRSVDDINVSTTQSSLPYIPALRSLQSRTESNSNYTIETSCSSRASITDATGSTNKKSNTELSLNKHYKGNRPNKWRAVTIVMLTTFALVITWIPYAIVVILFVFCEGKFTNCNCFYLSSLINGPMGILAASNSLLNPLIYAWWHKGFKESMKNYFLKCVQRFFYKR